MNLTTKIASLDWPRIETELTDSGHATTGSLLTPEQCRELAAGYEDATHFRSRIVMSRHGFGRGEYQYYSYPLPHIIQTLRDALYPPLAHVANKWNQALGNSVVFPAEHSAFKQLCHQAGQTRPTPLLLVGDHRGVPTVLYSSTDAGEFHRVCRAVLRAVS